MTNIQSDLADRISANERKISDLEPFSDDPKIAKIIRVLRKQIAVDQVSLATFRASKAVVVTNNAVNAPPTDY